MLSNVKIYKKGVQFLKWREFSELFKKKRPAKAVFIEFLDIPLISEIIEVYTFFFNT